MDVAKRFTLLIVEDDVGLARLQQRHLERAGYAVHTAGTAAAASQKVRQGGIDLLVLDQLLPGGVSGLELYRQLKADGLDLPAILVTGLREDKLLLEALRGGVRDFVPKTAEFLDYLVPAIERMLKQVGMEQQLAESRSRTREALRRQQELEAEIVERERKEQALREAEEALRVSRSRLDLVVDSTNLGLWYCDLPLDELIWNDNCKRHFGLPLDARVTIDLFYERIHGEDRERTRAAVERSIRDGMPYDVEYRTMVPDGEVRWIRAIGRAFLTDDGQAQHFDGLTVDVTEQKRAEEALRDADRLKDEFLAMLGHELRNPLAPIRNAVHVLRLRSPHEEKLREPLEMIERQLLHLTRLVDDLLDVSRITRGKVQLRKQTLTLSDVVTQAVETSRPLLEARRHHFEVQLPDEPIHLEADPTRLAQVILNLLNNAAKYTPEGGRIWLSVERQDGSAVLRVRDSGVGIPVEMLPKVFDLFAQVEHTRDQAQGGLGIGLTLVHRLAEMHGGSVHAFSAGHGLGSEFVVRLPILAEPVEPVEDKSGKGETKSRISGRRILIVDDNEDSAESLAMLLRLLGHDVRTAHDGEAGLETARLFGPDAVLLDIGLPRLNGLEVARRLRRDQGMIDALLIAMTGYGQEDDRRRSQDAGFNAHLVKPVDIASLRSLLEQFAPTAANR